MSKRMKDRMISTLVFAFVAILSVYVIYGEIKWPIIIGLMTGALISWYFIIPKLNKLRRRDKL
ncbi:hypothetical protein [Halobacillus faecis]